MDNNGKKTKIYLEDVHLGISSKTGNVYAGVFKEQDEDSKTLEWLYKVDVSSEFLACLFNFCPPGKTVTVEGAGRTFAVTIKDITKIVKGAEKKGGKILGLDGKPAG